MLTKDLFSGSQMSRVRYLVRPHTFVPLSAHSRRAAVSNWLKYVHEILVNRLGGLSLPRKSAVRLTDRPGMTIVVNHNHKTSTITHIHNTCFRVTNNDVVDDVITSVQTRANW